MSKTDQHATRRRRANFPRATAAGLLWSQGLAAVIWAGILLPSAINGSAALGRRRIVATVVVSAAMGAAALLVGTGLRRAVRGAQAAGLTVQAVLLAAALSNHRPVVITVVAALSVVTVAVVLAPGLAGETSPADREGRPPSGSTPRSEGAPDSEGAPGG